MKRAQDQQHARPVTAQPVGSRFAVATAGLHHREPGGPKWKAEDVSDNFIQMGIGCFRRVPTCKE